MAKRVLIIMMKPELRAEFKKYLEEQNVETDEDVIRALREFIKEKGIKAAYLRSEDRGGTDEENNPYSGSPFLN